MVQDGRNPSRGHAGVGRVAAALDLVAERGTELQVDTPKSGRVSATVVTMPHFDPTKEIPKQ